MSRKTFHRLAEDVRRKELIEAALHVVADGGIQAATTRNIAARAGVSAGLIRHHFESKEELLHEAFGYLVGELTGNAFQQSEQASGSPEARLAAFVAANLSRNNLQDYKVSVWATFIGLIRSNPSYAEIHQHSYGEFLDILAALLKPVLEKHEMNTSPTAIRCQAIALNGLIDGLWLEGALTHGFNNAKLMVSIGVESAENLLRLPKGALADHLEFDQNQPPSSETEQPRPQV